MANDLQNLGLVPLWNPQVLFDDPVEADFDFARQVIEYEGTSQEVIEIVSKRPQKYSFLVRCFSKAEEKALLDQFVAFKGRYERFWFPDPTNRFTLAATILIAATTITITANNWNYLGGERIYLLLADGSLITREVLTYGEAAAIGTMTVYPGLDRQIVPMDVQVFSILPLCRLENDVLTLKYHAKGISEAKVGLLEIPQEVAVAGVLAPVLVIESMTFSEITLSDESAPVPENTEIFIDVWSLEEGGVRIERIPGSRVGEKTISYEGKKTGWYEIYLNGIKATKGRFYQYFPSGVLFAATSAGLYRWDADLATWQNVPVSGVGGGLLAHNNNAAFYGYNKYSIDGGATWQTHLAGTEYISENCIFSSGKRYNFVAGAWVEVADIPYIFNAAFYSVYYSETRSSPYYAIAYPSSSLLDHYYICQGGAWQLVNLSPPFPGGGVFPVKPITGRAVVGDNSQGYFFNYRNAPQTAYYYSNDLPNNLILFNLAVDFPIHSSIQQVKCKVGDSSVLFMTRGYAA